MEMIPEISLFKKKKNREMQAVEVRWSRQRVSFEWGLGNSFTTIFISQYPKYSEKMQFLELSSYKISM